MDRFACAKTAMCKNYNSLFYDPHTHGVDALFQSDWGEFNNWVNPPFRLIPKILDILNHTGAQATVIAPMWPAQPFHYRLMDMSIAAPIRLPPAKRFCIPMGSCIPEPMKNPKWKIFAWRLSGKQD